MKLLIDTHVFLWLMEDDARFGQRHRQHFFAAEELVFSMVSYWETCIKHSAGKLDLHPDWEARFERGFSANDMRLLNLERQHCQQLTRLPHLHKDPFDRILIAQAQVESLAILTADRRFADYDVKVVW